MTYPDNSLNNIGYYNSTSSTNLLYNGSISNMRVYGVGRTTEKVEGIYNTEKSKFDL